jgi:hypothetical protein
VQECKNADVTLRLYRRHSLGCKAGHPVDFRSGKFEESRRGWKRCACPIVASGTLHGVFSRKNTGHYEWEQAEAAAAALEATSSWDGSPVNAAPPPEPAAPPQRTTVADAILVYLANREAANLAPASLRKYGVFARKIQAFANDRGYVLLDQFTKADIDIFYSTSKLGIRSKAKLLETLRTFFRFCCNRDLLAKSPVSSDLKPPIGANRMANKLPFTDEQLDDIIKACDHLEDQKWGNRHGSGLWTGEDVKDFIWLMSYTRNANDTTGASPVREIGSL